MTKLLLWDMDGTLSDDRHRQKYRDEGDYEKYFDYDAMMADPVYEEALALYREMKLDNWEMGYLTARLERNRPATVDWLTRNGFEKAESAYLRPEIYSRLRPPKFKSMLVGQLIESKAFERVVLVDNDLEVVRRVTEDHGAESVFFAEWGVEDPSPALLTAATT